MVVTLPITKYSQPLHFRIGLKEYMASKLTQKEIPFSEEEEGLQFLTDYCCVEQWKMNGLSSDYYFIENAVAINHCSRQGQRPESFCELRTSYCLANERS